MKYLPSAITLAGLAAGLAGLRAGDVALLAAALVADALDGWAARRFRAESAVGARLDWLADCALAHAALVRLGAWYGAPLLVVVQAIGAEMRPKTSGRTLLVLAAAVDILMEGA